MVEDQDNLWLAEAWLQHRDRLYLMLEHQMAPALRSRMGVDDVLQAVYLACGKRMDFLQSQPEVPMYAKLRRVAVQTLTDLHRHHLGAAKRDAMKESSPDGDPMMNAWAQFADSISSPRSHMVKLERFAMVRRVLTSLSETDRQILELRHFEEMSNLECAAVLEIEPKAASIRYIRALKRFRDLIESEHPYLKD